MCILYKHFLIHFIITVGTWINLFRMGQNKTIDWLNIARNIFPMLHSNIPYKEVFKFKICLYLIIFTAPKIVD